MTPSRRNLTIAGMGLLIGGALLMISGAVDTAVGLVFGIVGIAVLGSRPDPPDSKTDAPSTKGR